MCNVYLLWLEKLSVGRKVNSLNDDITTIIGLSRFRALLEDCCKSHIEITSFEALGKMHKGPDDTL